MLNNYHPCDIRRRSKIHEATDRFLVTAGRAILAVVGIALFLTAGRILFL